jgi:hypothetical protein
MCVANLFAGDLDTKGYRFPALATFSMQGAFMSVLRMFIPITKVDATRRLVYGLATAETEDRAGEICDYASTKPLYEKWSEEIAQSTGGKSFGNLRAMHGPVAAGKVTAITFNDAGKQIEICAKVVDDAEWAKVVEGVYTGFSQGGAYERRWTDAEGRTRYTAAPNEISLVDLPCLPQATFEMIKADGTSERRRFGKGMDNVARLANLIDELDWLQNAVGSEEMAEQDDSGVPGELRDLVGRASAILRTMVSEETEELAPNGASLAPMTMFAAPLKAASPKPPRLSKIGARNNEEDQARIQQLHDTSVELGAVCEAQKVMRGGLEKRFDVLVETIGDVLRRVKNIEEQPLPLPLLGQARAISKAEDVGVDAHDGGIETLLANPEALSVLAIKLAQRNGRSPLR